MMVINLDPLRLLGGFGVWGCLLEWGQDSGVLTLDVGFMA